LTLSAINARIADDIAESLRLLSHDLHPGVLQHLGLVDVEVKLVEAGTQKQ